MIISTLKKEMGFIPVHRYILQEKNKYTPIHLMAKQTS